MKKSCFLSFLDLTKAAGSDIWEGAVRYRLWLALAKEDVLDTYKHTSIGVLWAVFSFSFFAGSIILTFGLDSDLPGGEYAVHLISGLLAWNFISSIIGQATTIFTSNEAFIKGSKLPFSLFAFHSTVRALILNGFAAIGALVFLLWFGYPRSLVALACLPAVVLYAATAIPVQLLLGSLGAFTRDVQQIVDNIIRAVFFLTPVIWSPAPGTHRYTIPQLNPLTPYIEIFLDPILHGRIPMNYWADCLIMTALFWILAVGVFAYTRRHIVFWI